MLESSLHNRLNLNFSRSRQRNKWALTKYKLWSADESFYCNHSELWGSSQQEWWGIRLSGGRDHLVKLLAWCGCMQEQGGHGDKLGDNGSSFPVTGQVLWQQPLKPPCLTGAQCCGRFWGSWGDGNVSDCRDPCGFLRVRPALSGNTTGMEAKPKPSGNPVNTQELCWSLSESKKQPEGKGSRGGTLRTTAASTASPAPSPAQRLLEHTTPIPRRAEGWALTAWAMRCLPAAAEKSGPVHKD